MVEAPLGRISLCPDGRYTLVFERDLLHPRLQVWRAVTAAERLGCWLSEAEVELRPQGRIRLRGQCHVDGQVLEVARPVCFRWTWPHAEHPASEVTITVAAAGEGASKLSLTQTDLPKRHVLEVAAGWHTHLDALSGAVLGDSTPFNPDRAAAHYRRYAEVLAV